MQVSRRTFLALTGAASLSAALPGAVAQGPRPNLVFILGDDHRGDLLGCAGHPFLKTPHLDQLAAEGVRFSRACVTSAICCVSRASTLTGMHAARHRVIDFATPFREEDWKLSYPKVLRENGYKTGFFGKFGVAGKYEEDFDVFFPLAHGGPYFPKEDPGARHADDLHTEAAEQFIVAQAAAGQPFCVSLSFQSPHAMDYAEKPYQPAPAFQALYEDITVPHAEERGAPGLDSLPEFLKDSEGRRRYLANFGDQDEARFQDSMKNYHRMITGVDAYVGRVRETLARSGVSENTVIIYLGDNGYFLGERGLEGKWYAYEQCIHVPLIVFDPRLGEAQRGVVNETLVNEIDVSPTLLAAAGVGVPERVQGGNLLALMRGDSGPLREDYLYHHHFMHPRIPRSEGVVSQEWKYIRWIDGDPGAEMLFDLKADPWEVNNLAALGGHAEDLARLRKRHYALLSEMA